MGPSARALDGGIHTLLASLWGGSASAGPAVLAGLIAGLFAVVTAVSYPSLIFSGELAAYQATGISMALIGSVILATVMALTSSFPGTVATAQSEPAVVLGVMAASVTTGLGGVAASEAVLPTVVVLIVLSAAALGLVLLLLGTLGLANLIRFIPYPVVAGFLAGIGWLIFQGGFSALTGRPLRPESLAYMAEAETLIRWVPGLGLASALWALQRWRSHYLNLPALLLVAILSVWAVAWLAGASAADLQAGRWLLGPFPEGGLWTPLPHIATLGEVDWGMVLQQAPQIGTLIVVSVITVLLGASSLEVAVRRDIDLNRELSAVGAGNLLSALGGGFACYHSLSASTLAARIGSPVRLVGLVVALLCLLTLSFGDSVLSYVPKLVVGMLLLYVGLGFLIESLYKSWYRLPRSEYIVVLIVFAGIVLIGVMEGIGIGIVAGVILFVVNYSRIDVIRQALSGAHARSNVDRPEILRTALRERGEQSYVLKLQGYIFFGTSDRLLTRIRQRLANAASPPLRCLTLDFKRVSGLDSAALISFTKLAQYAEQWGFALVLTSLSPEIAHALETAGVRDGQHPHVRIFPDLDHGLEHAEDVLLAAQRLEPAGYADPLEDQLRRAFPDSAGVGRLMRYMEKVAWAAGEHLIRQGDASQDLFFVESGRVSVQLALAPGRTLRLRTMGAGTAVGELALYLGLPRSASVVADTATTTYRLTAGRLREMKRDDPDAAAMFHEFMARILAARLLDTNRLLEAYTD